MAFTTNIKYPVTIETCMCSCSYLHCLIKSMYPMTDMIIIKLEIGKHNTERWTTKKKGKYASGHLG